MASGGIRAWWRGLSTFDKVRVGFAGLVFIGGGADSGGLAGVAALQPRACRSGLP